MSLDLFLNDVFDIDSSRVSGISEIVSESSIRFDALFRSSSLTTNLAFHEAWKAATLGCHPTRLDYDVFVRNLPGSNPSSGVVWTEATANALVVSLSTGTQIRIHPQQTKLFQSTGEAYQRVLASLANTGPAGAKRLLVAKLSDRFGCITNQNDADSIISVYASLVLSDPNLKLLEKWASASSASTASAGNTDYSHPKSVVEYYERVAAAGSKLNIPSRDPITGLYLDLGSDPVTSLSCLEMLRIPLSRDGHLWRRDSGGSLLVLENDTQSMDNIVNHPSFKFRIIHGIPADYIYNALPLLLYSRVVVYADDFTVKNPRGQGDLVRIASKAIDTDVRLIVHSLIPPASRYWIPASESALFLEMNVSMLASHMQKPCPLQAAPNPNVGAIGGDLLYHDFVTRYMIARGLADQVFLTPSDGIGMIGEVVLIDNRANIWSITSILITLDNLRIENDNWAVTVFCSSSNLQFMRTHLTPRVPHAHIEVLDDLDKTPFDIETYNGILKSHSFWEKIRSPRALIVQDDGLLIRKGLEDDREILNQDFVGAPWIDVPDNRKMLENSGVGSGLVGNGGFSLRKVDVMRDIAREDEDGGSRYGLSTFGGNAQPVPEDVFFSAAVNRRGRSCPREVAERFAFEEKIPENNSPMGFHKPWPYSSPTDIAKFFDGFIEGVRSRDL